MLLPLGDRALIVRYGTELDAAANRSAIGLACRLEVAPLVGIQEVAPNLVSVLVRYDPSQTSYTRLATEIALLANSPIAAPDLERHHIISIRYGGPDGPDLEAVAGQLAMTSQDFIAAHQSVPLSVLAIGFAPGFIYCGMHAPELHIPRRPSVRAQVPAGSVLFAAGQTAIAATPIPTGWSVIGRTETLNFDPASDAPTFIRAGDRVSLETAQ